MDFISIGLGLLGGLVAGGAGALGLKKGTDGKKLKSADEQAQAILNKAKEAATTSDAQAKNRARNIEAAAKVEAEKEARKREEEARQVEKRVREKETQLDQKMTSFEMREKRLKEQEDRITQLEGRVGETLEQVKTKLEQASAMSQDEAKKVLIETMEGEAKHDA